MSTSLPVTLEPRLSAKIAATSAIPLVALATASLFAGAGSWSVSEAIAAGVIGWGQLPGL